MSRVGRVRAEFEVAWRSFFRRRTAVFFTFLFPAILVGIFGALVQTDPSGGGLFAEPPEYYVAGYVAVVVLFTPLSRMSSTVARHREGNRFEKLATTPLTRAEWLAAHALVNALIVGLAALLVLGLVASLTDASLGRVWATVPYVVAGVVTFCGLGAFLGRITDSRDGAVAASNAVGLPLLILSDTFVAPHQLPGWFAPLQDLSPLTYVTRGMRAAAYDGGLVAGAARWNLAVLLVVALVAFWIGAASIPQTD